MVTLLLELFVFILCIPFFFHFRQMNRTSIKPNCPPWVYLPIFLVVIYIYFVFSPFSLFTLSCFYANILHVHFHFHLVPLQALLSTLLTFLVLLVEQPQSSRLLLTSFSNIQIVSHYSNLFLTFAYNQTTRCTQLTGHIWPIDMRYIQIKIAKSLLAT